MSERRRFLKVLAAASVGAACGDEGETMMGAGGMTGAGGEGGAEAPVNLPEGFTHLGNVSAIPAGALVEAGAFEFFVGRDDAGLWAMTSRCTHRQCNMINNRGIIMPGLIECACHESQFDAVGNVVMGPAELPLQHFAVAVDEFGNIGVNPSEPVDSSTRTPVPA